MLAFSILISISCPAAAMSNDEQIELEKLQKGFVSMNKCAARLVFEKSAHKEYITTMQWLLEQGVELYQHNINWIFRSAGFNNKLSTMQWLLDKGMIPQQATINITFVSAIYDGYAILQLMLSLPLGKGKPDQDALNEAYTNAKKRTDEDIILLLKPHVHSVKRKSNRDIQK